MKNKKLKNWIKVCAISLSLVLLFGAVQLFGAQNGNASVSVDYTELHKSNLTSSISVKGVVESETSRKVYSTLNYTVKDVYVEAGDSVEEGDILAQLDTTDLKRSIEQKREDYSTSQQSNQNQLHNNQRVLSDAYANISNGTNAQIVNAETALRTAELNLEKAQKAYDDAVNDNENGINKQITSAESTFDTAKIDLEKKQKDYANNQVLFEAGALSKNELTLSENDLKNSEIQYHDAVARLENAKTSDTRALEQAAESLETAQTNYDNAVISLHSASTSAQQELSNYQNNVSSAQITLNNQSSLLSIEELEQRLEDSTIRSPINGRVTAVYAAEGSSGQGLLFVVEDVARLKIKTSIKEYDFSSVREGMPVVIRSDATGSEEYEGILIKIEPAAMKDGSGEIANSSDVKFGAEIAVVSSETNLRIGMNTRMDIILQSKDNIYNVPFEAVKMNANGNSVVYLIDEQGIARETVITTGLETDFYTEIEGEALFDGMKIADNADGLQDGMKMSMK